MSVPRARAAKQTRRRAPPTHRGIPGRPIVRVPGCPPIAEVMTGVITYYVTFGELPALDRQGRPLMFYSQRVHDKCYRRGHFDAGQFAETFDDRGSREGYCLYKVGCRGPTTYNACSTTRWNEGVSFPIASGHGCLGCSEPDFWDNGPFYERLQTFPQFGAEATANRIGATAAAGAGAGIGARAGPPAPRRARGKPNSPAETDKRA